MNLYHCLVQAGAEKTLLKLIADDKNYTGEISICRIVKDAMYPALYAQRRSLPPENCYIQYSVAVECKGT